MGTLYGIRNAFSVFCSLWGMDNKPILIVIKRNPYQILASDVIPSEIPLFAFAEYKGEIERQFFPAILILFIDDIICLPICLNL